MTEQRKADYSLASEKERRKIVEILQRNCRSIIKKRKTKKPEELKKIVENYIEGVRNGKIYTGKDFENLIRLFRKETIV